MVISEYKSDIFCELYVLSQLVLLVLCNAVYHI